MTVVNKDRSSENKAGRKTGSNRKVISLVALVFVLAVSGGFGGGMMAYNLSKDKIDIRYDYESFEGEGVAPPTAAEELISVVAEKIEPSVVSIVTSAGAFSEQGAGTGVVVSSDGYIMTNKHVIDGASEVRVIMADGVEHKKVEVVGSDPLNDIAFIKINGVNNLQPALLGDSGKLRVGQQVVAIGNALGQFQNTVTSGIVSAKGRPLVAATADGTASSRLSDLIQTDAAINPGNSGGPLVDLSGRVVGINTAISGDGNGLGFAIPINATKGLLRGLLDTGRVEKAYLGVRYIDITPAVTAAEGLDVKKGAYVDPENTGAVAAGSPAEKAGIQPGDIIAQINDDIVGEHGNMASLIGQYRPGEIVEIVVIRGDKKLNLKSELAAYRT